MDMGLERYRSTVAPYLDRWAGGFLSWSPNRLSWTSVSLSILAALTYALLPEARGLLPAALPVLLLAIALLIFLSGVFDVLDGYVARKRHLDSRAGDFLDHVLDRYADLALLLGIAASGLADPVLCLLALATLLLVSYMGTQAQAVGAGRLYGGLLGRADRLILLSGSALLLAFGFAVDLWAPRADHVPLEFVVGGFPVTILDLVMVYFLVAGQVTAISRAWTTWRSLTV